MNVRPLMIGVAAFAVAGVASAQSAPANDPQDQGPGGAPADLVVAASASTDAESDQPAPSIDAQPASSAAKPRRAARVTTCRCGDTGQSGQ